MVFGNSGIKQKKPPTTGTAHTEKSLNEKIFKPELLNVKVPKNQGHGRVNNDPTSAKPVPKMEKM